MATTWDLHVLGSLTTVSGAPSPATSGLSLTVTDASEWPTPTTPYNATVWPAASSNAIFAGASRNAERIRVTGKSGSTLTIVRAQEGTTARTIVAGDQIMASPGPGDFTAMQAAINTLEGYVPAAGRLTLSLDGAIPGGSGVAAAARALQGSATRYSAWAFDKTTAQAITTQFVVPSDYVSGGAFNLHWTNLGADTGHAVVWRLLVSPYSTTGNLNGGVGSSTDNTIAAPNQDILKISAHTAAPALAAGQLVLLQIVRVTGGADTLANNAGLIAVSFEYVK